MPTLLAVDLGLRTGLAIFGADGRLQRYRSTNFGSVSRLRRGIPGVLDGVPDLRCLVAEGDRKLFEIWQKEAERRGAVASRVAAEEWRSTLLLGREQRNGADAKRHADTLARRVIEWSGAPRPTSLRHDAAEAILIGAWGALQLGWLRELPADVRRMSSSPRLPGT